MNILRAFRILIVPIVIGLLGIAITLASAESQQNGVNKPPEVIKGGIWYDHFYNPQLVEGKNIDVQMSHLFLKLDEQLHWVQTWTAHFAEGEFYQTEAISDSVSLAPDGMGQYYITGTYTSTVFDAGRSVDWPSTGWRFSGIPDGLEMRFRTGNTPFPDDTWTEWISPTWSIFESYCVYTYNSNQTECDTNMSGIESSTYIQYSALFNSIDPAKTIALYDIDFLYGTHPYSGTALSILVPPVDLGNWDYLIITSTIPSSTSLVIDVLASDETLLVHDAHSGDSLASIDPHEYPALRLRASFTTTDKSLTPDVDLWGVRWSIMNKLYLPAILR
jgi:hypothetical protein